MNVKFKVMNHGSPVTLKMSPGQYVTHNSGGPTEEGFHWESCTWKLSDDGRTLTLESASGGSDCDGPHSWCGDFMCRVPDGIDSDGWPKWDLVDEERRDYFAEAAGY